MSQKQPENSQAQVSQLVPLTAIKLPKRQPRRYFDPNKLEQLVSSIQQYGVLEPLIVRPISKNTYELVAGERRYRAAKEVGLDEIPVVVRQLNERQALELALLENLQRDDLNPIDETEGLLDLLSQSLDISREEVVSLLNRAANAQKRGKTLTNNDTRQIEIVDNLFQSVGRLNRESFRTNRLPLLKMPADVLEVLRQGLLEYTKAKAIARVPDEVERGVLMKEAIEEQLSLREIKKRIEDRNKVVETTNLSKERGVRDELKLLVSFETEAWDDEDKKQRIGELIAEMKRILGM